MTFNLEGQTKKTGDNLILGVAIVWIVWQMFGYWRKIRTGGIIVTPVMAGTFIFALGFLIILLMGASPSHLLWFFSLSFALGIVLLFFPHCFYA